MSRRSKLVYNEFKKDPTDFKPNELEEVMQKLAENPIKMKTVRNSY